MSKDKSEYKSPLKSRFTMIPDELIRMDLPLAPLKVMLYFLSWQHSKKGIYMSRDTIATFLNYKIKTIERAIEYLKTKGFISIVSGKNVHGSNKYIINFKNIDDRCIYTPEQNELHEIEFKRKCANKITPREEELRDAVTGDDGMGNA